MKVKLIKVDKGYYNLEDEKGNVLGTSYQFNSSVGDVLEYKLSDKNCDEIFGVVDVEKLAEEYFFNEYSWNKNNTLPYKDSDVQLTKNDFIKGFNKAMELNKDKVFTEDDLRKAIRFGFNGAYGYLTGEKGTIRNQSDIYIQSIQQPTEIEVEIVKESIGRVKLGVGSQLEQMMPKLDASGCLILKKI
jgi:hypothetical protein